MKIRLTFFLMLFSLCNYSNNPGFLGKKIAFGYELGLNHPVLQGVKGKLPSFYNTLKLECTVKRSLIIGVSYMFHIYNNYPVAEKNFDYYSTFSPDFKGSINFHAVSFYSKLYKSTRYGHLAPLGYYIKPGIGFVISSDKFVSNVKKQYDSGYKARNVLVKSYLPFLKLGVGRDFIFLKRLVLDVGLDLNITLPNIMETDSYTSISGNSKPYLRASYDNLFLRNLFNVHIGISFLSF